MAYGFPLRVHQDLFADPVARHIAALFAALFGRGGVVGGSGVPILGISVAPVHAVARDPPIGVLEMIAGSLL